jgi:EAL domain-containing protein (putative c-di-GMP-specific phosphodiesterase class I)
MRGCADASVGKLLRATVSAADVHHDVAQILKETNLDPRWLELELTESSIMKDPEEAIEKLHELKLMGIRVAIDDFGTGYSSLNYLKRFPIDTLKIDKTFVSDVCKDPHDTAIVRAIINWAMRSISR